MAIPDYQQFMLPLLKLSGDGEVRRISAIQDSIVKLFGLTESELQEMLPSGQQSVVRNRLSWAKTYLVQAGLLEMTKRAHFKISPRGREVLENPPDAINIKFLSQFPEYLEFKGRAKTSTVLPEENNIDDLSDLKTPEDALDTAYEQIRGELAAELLAQIKGMSPHGFEKLVLDLMVAMGYGGAEGTAKLTGAGSDEGIDGIINEDRLGLESYCQMLGLRVVGSGGGFFGRIVF